ncbi:hypothetical protein D918_02033 [Trichuris suis]|nr:hypothetical protein D918_02033 [Trichuris suis]
MAPENLFYGGANDFPDVLKLGIRCHFSLVRTVLYFNLWLLRLAKSVLAKKMARLLASVPTLGTDMFYLVDQDSVQQIRTLITSVPMVLEVETFTNLTPIMYAMLKNKKKIVNIMAGRSPSRFRDSVLLGIYMGDVSAVSTIIRSG